jgi:hypothetical protein
MKPDLNQMLAECMTPIIEPADSFRHQIVSQVKIGKEMLYFMILSLISQPCGYSMQIKDEIKDEIKGKHRRHGNQSISEIEI